MKSIKVLSLLAMFLCWQATVFSASSLAAVEINVWEFPRIPDPDDPNDRFSWIKGIIADFEAQNPGITVRMTEMTWAQGNDKVKIAVLAGQMPDVCSGVVPLQFIDFGVVEPVDDVLTEEDLQDYYPGALNAFRYKGKTWGFPWAQRSDLLFLNLDLFKKAGVTPPSNGRWSWDEFESSIRSISELSNDADKIWGTAWAFAPGVNDIYGLLLSGGGWFFQGEPPEFSLHKGKALESIERTLSLAGPEGPAPPDVGGYQVKDVWLAFTERQSVGVAPFGIWAIPGLNRKPEINYTIASFPDGPDGKPVSLTATIGHYVFRSDNPEKTLAAKKFARFLTNSENQKLLKRYGQFPTRISTGDLYQDDPIMSLASSLIVHGRAEPMHPRWTMMDDMIKRRLQDAALGISTTKEALASLAPSINAMMQAKVEKKTSGDNSYYRNIFVLLAIAAILWSLFSLWRGPGFKALWRSRFSYAFIAPAMIVFVIFMVWPVFWSILLAFQNFGMDKGMFEGWVGFGNFKAVFADLSFKRAAINTALYTIFVVPATVFSALVLASLIHPLSKRAGDFYRAAFYLPGVASVVVMAMVWRWIFDVQYGVLNAILGVVGIAPVEWLTSPDWSLFSIALSTILRGPGGALLIYLAAMSSIPESLYEAASIDGAGTIRKWWNITVPMLAPTTLFLVITQTIASFQVFAQVLMLTDGGPGDSSTVLVHRIYAMAFRDLDIGPASAMALLLFLFIVTVSLIQFRFFRSGWESQ